MIKTKSLAFSLVLCRIRNTVCDVIDMGGKVVALVALRDEGTEFYVFPGYLLKTEKNSPEPVKPHTT